MDGVIVSLITHIRHISCHIIFFNFKIDLYWDLLIFNTGDIYYQRGSRVLNLIRKCNSDKFEAVHAVIAGINY